MKYLASIYNNRKLPKYGGRTPSLGGDSTSNLFNKDYSKLGTNEEMLAEDGTPYGAIASAGSQLITPFIENALTTNTKDAFGVNHQKEDVVGGFLGGASKGLAITTALGGADMGLATVGMGLLGAIQTGENNSEQDRQIAERQKAFTSMKTDEATNKQKSLVSQGFNSQGTQGSMYSAKYGGNLPKYEDGKRLPIKVSDPNDPRLKTYNDSATAYNVGTKRYWEALKATEKSGNTLEDKGTIEEFAKYRKENFNGDERALVKDLHKWDINGVSPVKLFQAHVNDVGYRVGKFQKPIQPYVYEKPNNKPVVNNRENNNLITYNSKQELDKLRADTKNYKEVKTKDGYKTLGFEKINNVVKPKGNTKVYTNEAEFNKANQMYNDSNTIYNKSSEILKKEENKKISHDFNKKDWQNTWKDYDSYSIGDARFDKISKLAKKTGNLPIGNVRTEGILPVWKKPNTKPIYQPTTNEPSYQENTPIVQQPIEQIKPTYSSPKQFYQGREFMDSTQLQPNWYHPEEITERMKDPNRKFGKGGEIDSDNTNVSIPKKDLTVSKIKIGSKNYNTLDKKFRELPLQTGKVNVDNTPIDIITGSIGAYQVGKGIYNLSKAMTPNMVQFGEELINLGYHPKSINRAKTQITNGVGNLLFGKGGNLNNPQYLVEGEGRNNDGEIVEGSNVKLASQENIASNLTKATGDSHDAQSGGTAGRIEKGGENEENRVHSGRIPIGNRMASYLKANKVNVKSDTTVAKVTEILGREKGRFEKRAESKNPLAMKTAKVMIERIDGLIDANFENQENIKGTQENNEQSVMANGGEIPHWSEGAKYPYRIKDNNQRNYVIKSHLFALADDANGDMNYATKALKDANISYGTERQTIRPNETYFGFDANDINDNDINNWKEEYNKEFPKDNKDMKKYGGKLKQYGDGTRKLAPTYYDPNQAKTMANRFNFDKEGDYRDPLSVFKGNYNLGEEDVNNTDGLENQIVKDNTPKIDMSTRKPYVSSNTGTPVVNKSTLPKYGNFEDYANAGAYISNLFNADKYQTNIERKTPTPTYMKTPNNLGYAKNVINSEVSNEKNAVTRNSGNIQDAFGRRSALTAIGLEKTNQAVQDQTNAEIQTNNINSQIENQYKSNLYGNSNQDAIDKALGKNTILANKQTATNTFLQGVMGNNASRRAYDVDSEKNAIARIDAGRGTSYRNAILMLKDKNITPETRAELQNYVDSYSLEKKAKGGYINKKMKAYC